MPEKDLSAEAQTFQLLRIIIKGYRKETKTWETLTQLKSITALQNLQRSQDFTSGT